jgi:hypothetical protein
VVEGSCFYEVYVRSFQDSTDDRVGDLNGITSRLPYLQDLGIEAIWVTSASGSTAASTDSASMDPHSVSTSIVRCCGSAVRARR